MNITVNGEQQRFDRALSVQDLLHHFGIEPRKIAVERNLEIVPRSAYETTALADGDRIEIVQFVGGG